MRSATAATSYLATGLHALHVIAGTNFSQRLHLFTPMLFALAMLLDALPRDAAVALAGKLVGAGLASPPQSGRNPLVTPYFLSLNLLLLLVGVALWTAL